MMRPKVARSCLRCDRLFLESDLPHRHRCPDCGLLTRSETVVIHVRRERAKPWTWLRSTVVYRHRPDSPKSGEPKVPPEGGAS